MRNVLFRLGLFVVCLSALGCGGGVADVSEPERIREATPARKPANGPSASPSTEESGPAPTCSPVPVPVTGTDSCAVAREHLDVEGVALEWRDPGTAGRVGSTASFTIRYRNTAANSGIHYPGVRVFSSDPRVKTGTEEHGDPAVHPDYYMIAECSTQASAFQSVHVVQEVPSGTRIDLRLEPAVATGDGIDSCGDTLKKSTFSFAVP